MIELVLANDAAFVTPNVYLENGHTEQRITPLKLSFSYLDLGLDEKSLRLNEPAHKHEAALKSRIKIASSL